MVVVAATAANLGPQLTLRAFKVALGAQLAQLPPDGRLAFGLTGLDARVGLQVGGQPFELAVAVQRILSQMSAGVRSKVANKGWDGRRRRRRRLG